MNKTFNLLFYVKKAKINSAGEAPIYLRITIDCKISEISTKRTSKPLKWNSAMQKVSGSSEESKSLNFYLKTLEQKVYETYHELMRETVTCEVLKNKLLGKVELTRTLIPVFQDHNDRMEKLVKKEFAPGTLIRYKTTLKHTKEFLKWKYNISDIQYLKSRKVYEQRNLVKEIYCELNDKKYFGIGFFNNSFGVEIRNKYSKICLGKKDVTLIINDLNISSEIAVFEGFFDYQTYRNIEKIENFNSDYLILNSTAVLFKVEKRLKKYDKISLFWIMIPMEKRPRKSFKKSIEMWKIALCCTWVLRI